MGKRSVSILITAGSFLIGKMDAAIGLNLFRQFSGTKGKEKEVQKKGLEHAIANLRPKVMAQHREKKRKV